MQLALIALLAVADSPVTSTDFHTAYADVPLVKKALEEKALSDELAEALAKGDMPIDHKAAIVNALGWGDASHEEKFRAYLKDRAEKDPPMLSGEEAFVLGYLTLMNDYFHPDKALELLRYAKERMPKSYTVAMILSLAESQAAMDQDWCRVFKIFDRVDRDRSLRKDLRPKARAIVAEYLGLYRESCGR